jgi:hypothetical protein
MIDALKKIEEKALQEIKDYSTGKKYFVSKFQEKVRKRKRWRDGTSGFTSAAQ